MFLFSGRREKLAFGTLNCTCPGQETPLHGCTPAGHSELSRSSRGEGARSSAAWAGAPALWPPGRGPGSHPPDGCPLPVLQVVVVVVQGLQVSQDTLLLQAGGHRELVQGHVGLRGGVARGREAAAGFAAVVAVPVVHGTVMVFKSCKTEGG